MKGTIFKEFIKTNDCAFEQNIGLDCVMNKLINASIEINDNVNRAGLLDIYGKTEKENVQGEEMMKLDEIANNILIDHLKDCPFTAGLASEEMDTFIDFDRNQNENQYVVLFDPLDGSGNIDTNASIGTIFCIFKKTSQGSLTDADFTQNGGQVTASGYMLYGSSTILVYSTGNGVHEFTLNPESKEYLLSQANIQTPKTATQYSINQGNHKTFSPTVNQFLDWVSDIDKETKRPYSLRYIGTMVADFHRNLVKGGIYIYPATDKAPNGKLRLMYECIPLSFIQLHAGGTSTNDKLSILDIQPTELHQRTPIALGSQELVDKYCSFINLD